MDGGGAMNEGEGEPISIEIVGEGTLATKIGPSEDCTVPGD